MKIFTRWEILLNLKYLQTRPDGALDPIRIPTVLLALQCKMDVTVNEFRNSFGFPNHPDETLHPATNRGLKYIWDTEVSQLDDYKIPQYIQDAYPNIEFDPNDCA